MTLLSLSAFFITLRETMEAALIVGILLAYLTKTDNERLKKDIWIGTTVAVIFSIIGAIIFEVVFGGFEGDTEKLFEGIVMVTAAAVLTWMIIWMFRSAKYIKAELEEKTQQALSEEKKYTLVMLAFISVFREGIETVLFLAGVSTTEDSSAVLFSGLIGIIVAIILAILLFKGSLELDLKRFFNITSIILILFAAGLFSHGIHEFQELGWFGAETTMWNKPLWDWSSKLNDTNGTLGPLLRTMFGYQDKPSFVEIGAYIFYCLVIIFSFVKVNGKAEVTKKATSA